MSEFKKKGETAYILEYIYTPTAYSRRGYANILMQHIFGVNPEVVSLCNPEVVSLCNTRSTGIFLRHCGFKYLGCGEYRHTVLSI